MIGGNDRPLDLLYCIPLPYGSKYPYIWILRLRALQKDLSQRRTTGGGRPLSMRRLLGAAQLQGRSREVVWVLLEGAIFISQQ